MGLLRNLVILVLIFLLILITLNIVLPIIAWAFKLAFTLILLCLIGFAIMYLYRKLRTWHSQYLSWPYPPLNHEKPGERIPPYPAFCIYTNTYRPAGAISVFICSEVYFFTKRTLSIGRDSYLDTKLSILENRPTKESWVLLYLSEGCS